MEETNAGLYSGSKSNKGFDPEILAVQAELIDAALAAMKAPRAAHIVINEPNKAKLKELQRIIARWSENELKSKSLWLYCLEVRPRLKELHLHLHVIGDGLTQEHLVFLNRKLSTIGESKIQKRKISKLRLRTDLDTGEIQTNSDGSFGRTGSIYWSCLRKETLDYKERFSYLAKYQTKETTSGEWSYSKNTLRIIQQQGDKQHGTDHNTNNNQTNHIKDQGS